MNSTGEFSPLTAFTIGPANLTADKSIISGICSYWNKDSMTSIGQSRAVKEIYRVMSKISLGPFGYFYFCFHLRTVK